MPDFVLNRNYTMRTTYGHIINFKKGVPVHVPPICARDAAAIGAEAVGEKVDPLGAEEVVVAPLPPDERKARIFAAFKTMQERNERSDFTGNGGPAKAALINLVGFEVDKKEYDPLWQEFRTADQDGE